MITQVYLYSDGSPILIAGDFNAPLGTSSDYYEILDQVPARAVLDTDRNQQGENLREYLKDNLHCVLNGRFCPENDNFVIARAVCSGLRACAIYMFTFSEGFFC